MEGETVRENRLMAPWMGDKSRDVFAIYRISLIEEVDSVLEYAICREGEEYKPVIDMAFGRRIKHLENLARHYQYQLAYISTLGGAYHLCNRPIIALQIAKRQELVGRSIGSSAVVIRAILFQAVNWRMLEKNKKSKQMLKQCKDMVRDVMERNPDMGKDLLMFVESNEEWLNKNYPSNRLEELGNIESNCSYS